MSGVLTLRGIKKRFVGVGGDTRNVIDLSDAQFPNRGLFVILGPSGCGKTTLLNLISSLEPVDEGTIEFDGKDITKLNEKEANLYRHNHIGFLFQKSELLPYLNVFDNVCLPYRISSPFINKEEERSYIRGLLERFGIAKLEHDFPATLSGGEGGRVALVRALAMKPRLLLADEPTAALGKQEAKSIMECLRSVSQESLVLVVSHDEALMKEYADGMYRLEDGDLKADAENEEPAKAEIPATKRGSMFPLAAKRFGHTFGKKIMASLVIGFGILGSAISLGVKHGVNDIGNQLLGSNLQREPLSVSYYYAALDNAFNSIFDSETTNEPYVYPKTTDEATLHINLLTQEFMDYLSANLRPDQYRIENQQVFSLLFHDADGYRVFSGGETPSSGNIESFLTTFLGTNATLSPSKISYTDLPSQHDCLYGRFPQNDQEAFLVVDRRNTVAGELLDLLGLHDAQISFDQIVGKELKFVPDDALYQKRALTQMVTGRFLKEEGDAHGCGAIPILSDLLEGILAYNAGDVERSKELMADMASHFGPEETRELSAYTPYRSNEKLGEIYGDETLGKKIKITGILRMKPDTLIAPLSSGLYYSPVLQKEMATMNEGSNLAKEIAQHMVYKDSDTILNYPHTYSFFDQVKDETSGDIGQVVIGLYNHFQRRRAFGINDGPSSVTFTVNNYHEAIAIRDKIDAFNAPKSTQFRVLYWDYGIVVSQSIESYVRVLNAASLGIFFIIAISNLLMLTLFAFLDAKGRIHEIGLYRALGARKGKVLGLFLYEGALLGILSAFIGLALSYITLPTFNYAMRATGAGTVVSFLARLSFPQAMIISLLAIATSLFATAIAALVYTRKAPSQAMRRD